MEKFYVSEMKILCVIPSLPNELNFKTIKSILNQTCPVEMIVILPKKVEGHTIAEKLSKVLNGGLNHLKLESFDYVLRVDSDVMLPSNFLKENLKQQPDLSGSAGYAMLIKTSTFLRVMKGKFHPKSDDSYTSYKFMKENCKVYKNQVKPVLTRPSGKHHGIKYFLDRGKAMYRLGYEPLHVLASFRWASGNIFAVFGYFVALLKCERKFDVADFVWQKQVRKLFKVKGFLKRFFLKYIVGYTNPQKYWDMRWKLGLKAEERTEHSTKVQLQEITNVMRQHGCSNILEVGCGKTGLHELPGYLGLDFSLESLRKSGLKQFIYADITEKIPLPDKSQDAVLSRFVLLHIPFDKIDVAVREISRVAKKCVILYEPWSLKVKHSQPHCFSHNLPVLFKKYSDNKKILFLMKKKRRTKQNEITRQNKDSLSSSYTL